MKARLLAFAAIGAAMGADTAANAAEPAILKWKDGKRGVFLLEYDDSCETHITKAIPELVKRDLVGTFYINPGNGPYQNRRKDWEEKVASMPQIVIANHTFKHKGAPDFATVDEDMRLSSEHIAKHFSAGKKARRLVSFGQPGGVPWKISGEEFQGLLKKYDLVNRPPFAGFPFNPNTPDGVLALVDQAIEKGDMRHHDFHGVGGDWLVTPFDLYIQLLDKLAANRDKLWVTDPVSWHQYKTERESAKLSPAPAPAQNAAKGAVWLSLDIATDPALYDLPLTAEVSVPADWTEARVAQRTVPENVMVADKSFPAKDGIVRFDLLPVKSEIVVLRKR